MSEMIERVARVIARGTKRGAKPERVARSVIAAMREPTEPMKMALSDWRLDVGDAEQAWLDMIDEILWGEA